MNIPALLVSGAIALTSIPTVLGHGYIVDPAAVWQAGYAENGYPSTVDNDMWGSIDNSVYGYGVQATVDFFKATYPTKGYDSLKDFILTNQVLLDNSTDAECGYTIHDTSKLSDMPSTEITYSGFTHQGPCELWCDDNLLAFDYDCYTTYSDGKVPIDSSLCDGATEFQIYWLALHGDPWQVYPDCVWLSGATESTASSDSTASTTTTSTTSSAATDSTTSSASTTTSTPTTTSTAASVGDDADASASTTSDTTASATEETTPTPTTTAPATTTATPTTDSTTTTSTNCRRRMRN